MHLGTRSEIRVRLFQKAETSQVDEFDCDFTQVPREINEKLSDSTYSWFSLGVSK